uniref:Uncharacterized protein n=1 Tax=Tanacetum cinerariifolium TaxID=118510 RepID=A0A6L2P374_TANCI|nr:hypothetical protein [Tanacetum cinerariifolium]
MVESETPKKQKVQEQIDAQVARELEEQLEREDQRRAEQIAKDAKIARIHSEEELQSMIDGLDRNNETIAKYLKEYHQFSSELPIERRVELISDLVKKESKLLEEREGATATNSRDDATIKGRSMDEGEAATERVSEDTEDMETVLTSMDAATVLAIWKQMEDFIPMGSKEEAERIKRKVPIEEVYVEALQVKHPIIDWKVHTEGQRSYWKITRLGGSSASYQFFVDMLKQIDREDLNQLWALVKETLSIRPVTDEKEMELWVELKRLYEPDIKDHLWTHTQHIMHAPVEWRLYDTCGVHHVMFKDLEIFMLVEKNYPFRKGLALVMICYKLQVENYSQMATDQVRKIQQITGTPSLQGDLRHPLQKKDFILET